MARLSRVTSKLFAENATEVGQFGSLNAGTKVPTTDIATIQALPAWQDGWQAATLGDNCYPTLQERNGLDKVLSYFLNYLYQEGIPEWDNGTTYYTGSIVKLINGTNVQLYQSLVDNNTAALSDTTAWMAWDYADRTLSNVTSLSNNIKTLLNAVYLKNTPTGSTSRPIYINPSGSPAALTATIGSSENPIYMANGTLTACSDATLYTNGKYKRWIFPFPKNSSSYFCIQMESNVAVASGNKVITFPKEFTAIFGGTACNVAHSGSFSSVTALKTTGMEIESGAWGSNGLITSGGTRNYTWCAWGLVSSTT